MLKFAGPFYRVPDNVYVHGFITFTGEKMSKSRGTGVSPLKYLELGINPEWLRYYIAAKLNAAVEDVDFNPDDFVARVNSDLVGKYVNIASRARASSASGSTASSPYRNSAPSSKPRSPRPRTGSGRTTKRASSAGRCARSCSSPTSPISTSTSASRGSSRRTGRRPLRCKRSARPRSPFSAT